MEYIIIDICMLVVLAIGSYQKFLLLSKLLDEGGVPREGFADLMLSYGS